MAGNAFMAHPACFMGSRGYKYENVPVSYLRRPPPPPVPITLPRVSILETPTDLTEADFRLGKACQSAAGY